MRDPKRIDEILELIGKIWKASPDLRLLQLLSNVTGLENGYYLEDDAFLEQLRAYGRNN